MWDLLKPSDIEQAKQALQVRRAEILRRHQHELAGLDSDRAEVESLDRLADAFLQKYRRAVKPLPAAAPAPAPAAVRKAVPAVPPPFTGRGKPPPEVITVRREGERAGTNFDVFSRAVSKATF